MSTATDGQICFGIMFDEDYEFPWQQTKYNYDIKDWWLTVNNFNPSVRHLNYFPHPSLTKEEKETLYKEKANFFEECPIPAEEVNYCSTSYPMYILAIPETVKWCSRGYPEKIGNLYAQLTDRRLEAFTGFIKQYGIETNSCPTWYLSSFWE